MFTNEQITYLNGKLGDKVTAGFLTAIELGLGHTYRPVLEANLGKEDADNVLSLIGNGATASPFSKPGSVSPVGNLISWVAELLTVTRRDGTVIRKGALAKVYRDNLSLWPTVDAFGRPFPSLQAITQMARKDAKLLFTTSGYAKCRLDGLSYYQHMQAGHSLLTLTKVAQQEAAHPGVKVDMATVPVDIPAMSWRWYNNQQGPSARYGRPDQHEAICAMLGIVPTEYRALPKPKATTAPAEAVKPSRSRRKADTAPKA